MQVTGRSLSVAFVLPYGEPDPGFFPDGLMELLCARTRAAGHRASLLRVYYDGRDRGRDAEVRQQVIEWLSARDADVVVVERLFDTEPVTTHVRAGVGRLAVGVCWGSWEPSDGVELVLGLASGVTADGSTRRSPAAGDLVNGFGLLLDSIAAGTDPLDVPGVSRASQSGVESRHPLAPAPLPSPFAPALDYDVICLQDAPRIVRKHLFGNAGCPYAADPLATAHHAGLPLAETSSLSRLGCAFCHAGGDYQKRPDSEVVESLIEQARYYQDALPDLGELVIVDQHPVRYLSQLLDRAREMGLRPTRWLFQTRADTFVRERQRVRAALDAARDGHVLELYLVGFETFSDRELLRYNKGATAAELIAAVREIRALARAYPDRFEYARARGHSLVLWSPWTSPADIAETIAAVRAHGLGELFSELARNRLRLYRDLPLYHAARRDDLLVDRWESGDEGAGRRKGYSLEQPWRFLDPSTREAYRLSIALRDHLGRDTELSQLAAATQLVQRSADGRPGLPEVLEHVRSLEAALLDIARRPGRASSARGAVVRFHGPCENQCGTCPNTSVFRDASTDALVLALDAARELGGPVVFAGREPTLHAAFLELLRRAAGQDDRAVCVVTNGRSFADSAFTDGAVGAGLRAASVKLFASDAKTADRLAGSPGGFLQACAGVKQLVAHGVSVELRFPLHRELLDRYAEVSDVARSLGVARVRAEVDLEAVGLDRLSAARTALDHLAEACRRHGLSLDASPLSSGTGWFAPVPMR